MDFLKTSVCCCGTSLRTGGIIIGFLFILCSIPVRTVDMPWTLVWVTMYSFWLHGIYKEKTNWMLPALCYNIFKLLVFALSIILIPILGIIFADDIQKFLDENARKTDNRVVPTVFAFVITMWISAAILTAVQYHIAAVMNSLYKSMREEGYSLIEEAHP